MIFSQTTQMHALNKIITDILEHKFVPLQLEELLLENSSILPQFKKKLERNSILETFLSDPYTITLLMGSKTGATVLASVPGIGDKLFYKPEAIDAILSSEVNFGLFLCTFAKIEDPWLLAKESYEDAKEDPLTLQTVFGFPWLPLLCETTRGRIDYVESGFPGADLLATNYARLTNATTSYYSAYANLPVAMANPPYNSVGEITEYFVNRPEFLEAILGSNWGPSLNVIGEYNYGTFLYNYFRFNGYAPPSELSNITGSNFGQYAGAITWMLNNPKALRILAESPGIFKRQTSNTSYVAAFLNTAMVNRGFLSYFMKPGVDEWFGTAMNHTSYFSNTVASNANFLEALFREEGFDFFKGYTKLSALATQGWAPAYFKEEVVKPEKVHFLIEMLNNLQWTSVYASTRQILDRVTDADVWPNIDPYLSTTGGLTPILNDAAARSVFLEPTNLPILRAFTSDDAKIGFTNAVLGNHADLRLRLLDEDTRSIFGQFVDLNLGTAFFSSNDSREILIDPEKLWHFDRALDSGTLLPLIDSYDDTRVYSAKIGIGETFEKILNHATLLNTLTTRSVFRVEAAKPENAPRLRQMLAFEEHLVTTRVGWINNFTSTTDIQEAMGDTAHKPFFYDYLDFEARISNIDSTLIPSVPFFNALIENEDPEFILDLLDDSTPGSNGDFNLKGIWHSTTRRQAHWAKHVISTPELRPIFDKWLKDWATTGQYLLNLADVRNHFIDGANDQYLFDVCTAENTQEGAGAYVPTIAALAAYIGHNDRFELMKDTLTTAMQDRFASSITYLNYINTAVTAKYRGELFKRRPMTYSAVYSNSAWYGSASPMLMEGCEEGLRAIYSNATVYSSYLSYGNYLHSALAAAAAAPRLNYVLRSKEARRLMYTSHPSIFFPTLSRAENLPFIRLFLEETTTATQFATHANALSYLRSDNQAFVDAMSSKWWRDFAINSGAVSATIATMDRIYNFIDLNTIQKADGLGSSFDPANSLGWTPGHPQTVMALKATTNNATLTMSYAESAEPDAVRKTVTFTGSTAGTTAMLNTTNCVKGYNWRIEAASHPAVTYSVYAFNHGTSSIDFPSLELPPTTEE